MKKLYCLLLIMLLAAACGTAEPKIAPASSSDSNDLAASMEEPTATPEEVEEVMESETETETAVSSPPQANSDFTPATTAAEAAIIRSHDWVKGATEPTVTIIEYGDYQ